MIANILPTDEYTAIQILRLIRVFNAKGVDTVIGKESPKITIEDFVVLKEGTEKWGWRHIKIVHIDTGDFYGVFGTSDEAVIKEMIAEVCRSPDTNYFRILIDANGKPVEYRLAKNFGTAENPKWLYVSVNGEESINTAIPTTKTPYIDGKF